ncbi:MAG: hypothetical protein K0U52_02210 [Gammaproteobacteria bacterium]|nr:hypothetical protein [Gammaproteobacteria bacterium]
MLSTFSNISQAVFVGVVTYLVALSLAANAGARDAGANSLAVIVAAIVAAIFTWLKNYDKFIEIARKIYGMIARNLYTWRTFVFAAMNLFLFWLVVQWSDTLFGEWSEAFIQLVGVLVVSAFVVFLNPFNFYRLKFW